MSTMRWIIDHCCNNTYYTNQHQRSAALSTCLDKRPISERSRTEPKDSLSPFPFAKKSNNKRQTLPMPTCLLCCRPPLQLYLRLLLCPINNNPLLTMRQGMETPMTMTHGMETPMTHSITAFLPTVQQHPLRQWRQHPRVLSLRLQQIHPTTTLFTKTSLVSVVVFPRFLVCFKWPSYENKPSFENYSPRVNRGKFSKQTSQRGYFSVW